MLKSFLGKIVAKGKLVAAGSAMALTAVGSAVVASADDGSSSSVTSVITNAGNQLTSEFTNLASTIAPILIGIGVVGLGIYAVVYLFKMAKKFFGKAAG